MGDSHRFEILCDDQSAGAVVIRYPWLAGPYLQMLAILPAYQGQASAHGSWIGMKRKALNPNLAKSGSASPRANTNAQRFYRRHGYELTATLDGLMRDGDDELLMRKRLKPCV